MITTVDGQPVTLAGEADRADPGQAGRHRADVGYTRGGKPGTATITTEADDDGSRRGSASRSSRSSRTRSTLKIDLDDIGGPSAGLMFALGIIDKLEPEDLTGGKVIAGTGTIDDEGNVGPIGGIPQKLVGAKDAGADALPGAGRQLRRGRRATPCRVCRW